MAYPKDLIGKVSTRPNLNQAWKDISQSSNLLSRGSSEQTIQDFGSNLRDNIEIVRSELLNGSYQFGNVRGVTIKKKGGKKRPLRIADIRDRVVQRAITRKLEPLFEKEFQLRNPASYAYMKRRGVQSAINRMLQFHQQGCRIVFEADIVDFFGTVDVDSLLEKIILPRLPDNTLDHLIKSAFDMEIGNRNELPEEDWELFPESSTGLPQGGYLSPLFSNIYLSAFDHQMLEAQFNLIRYADDFIVMCKTIEEAEKAYQLSLQILENDLGLKLHERDDSNSDGKTRIVKLSQTPIQFLGMRFNGSRIWPASEKRLKLSQKLIKINQQSKTVLELLTSMRNLLEGWVAAYGFTDIHRKYAAKIDDEVNSHLRNALRRMDWKLSSKDITDEQRLKSGILLVGAYLLKTRSRLSDRALWEAYWTDIW